MKLFRIAKAQHIEDLTGEGARINGARWNEKGVPLIYTSESLSLAAWEFLVHVAPLFLVPPLMHRSFIVPDDLKVTGVRTTSLPEGWDALPFQEETVQIGSEWARSGKTLLLRVPSVMVPGEYNVLINPRHPDFDKVKASRPLPFMYDNRILERMKQNKSLG